MEEENNLTEAIENSLKKTEDMLEEDETERHALKNEVARQKIDIKNLQLQIEQAEKDKDALRTEVQGRR